MRAKAHLFVRSPFMKWRQEQGELVGQLCVPKKEDAINLVDPCSEVLSVKVSYSAVNIIHLCKQIFIALYFCKQGLCWRSQSYSTLWSTSILPIGHSHACSLHLCYCCNASLCKQKFPSCTPTQTHSVACLHTHVWIYWIYQHLINY